MVTVKEEDEEAASSSRAVPRRGGRKRVKVEPAKVEPVKEEEEDEEDDESEEEEDDEDEDMSEGDEDDPDDELKQEELDIKSETGTSDSDRYETEDEKIEASEPRKHNYQLRSRSKSDTDQQCSYNSYNTHKMRKRRNQRKQESTDGQRRSFKAKKKSLLYSGESSPAMYKCSKCDFNSPVKRYVKRHEQYVHTDKKFGCKFCKFASNYKIHLRSHLLKKHQVLEGAEPFKCPHCPFNTFHKQGLKRHTPQHDEQSLICQKCSFKTKKKLLLFRHEIEMHGESSFTTYKCSECDYSTPRKENLTQHKQTVHSDKKKFSCKFCEYTSNYKNVFRLHLFKKHQVKEGDEPLKCPHCPFISFRTDVFKIHVLHHDKQPLVCQECSFKADEKESLFKHQIEAHGKSSFNNYKCSKCNYKASSKNNLKTHEQTVHTDQKRFGCKFCQFDSNDKRFLRMHVFKKHQVLEGAEPFKCPHCPYNTLRRSDLKKHALRHDKQLLICQECSFKADRKVSLFRHQIKTHGKSSFATYKCSKCDYKALQKSNVKQHEQNIHTDHKKFGCDFCEFASNLRSNLKSHLFSKHQVKDGLECQQRSYSTVVPSGLNKNPDKHKELPLICQKGSKKKSQTEVHAKPSFTIYKCSECDFTSCQRWALRRHETSMHKDLKEKLKCRVCEYSTGCERSLKSHLLKKHHIADGDKLFKCSHCEYQSYCGSTFRRHVKTHQEEKAKLAPIKQEAESKEEDGSSSENEYLIVNDIYEIP